MAINTTKGTTGPTATPMNTMPGYSQPGPSTDPAPQAEIPAHFGTHIGSTAQHPTKGWMPKRRNIKTNAK